MVEYGAGIAHGPAGQVAGSSGAHPDLGTNVDFFGSVTHSINDGVNFVLAQPPEVLIAGIVVFFLALIVLKRAF